MTTQHLAHGNSLPDLTGSFISRDEALIAAGKAQQSLNLSPDKVGVREVCGRWHATLQLPTTIGPGQIIEAEARVLCDNSTGEPKQLEVTGYTEGCDSGHDECRRYDLNGNLLRSFFVPR